MDGKQMAVVNDWDKKTTFYKMWPAEADIREGAKRNKNAYIIGVFACCREIFNSKTHRDLFGGTEVQASVAFSTKRKKDELNARAAKEQALTDAEEISALKERIEELKTEAKIQKRIEQNRRKKTGLNTLKERLGNAVKELLGKFTNYNMSHKLII